MTDPTADLLAILARGETLAVLAVVTFAATVRGFAGFGAGMIYIPVAAALYGPKVAAATLLLFDLPAVIPATIRLLPQADVRDVAPIALGGLVGVPLGFLALSALDPVAARWAISAIVIVCVAALASGWRVRRDVGPAVSGGVGVVAGFLNGLAQIGAPPVVLFWLGRDRAPATIRASASLYFLIGSGVTMTTYLIGGLITREVVLLALVLAPVYAAGLWLGSLLFGFASPVFYRRFAYGVIAAAAVAGLPIWR